MKIFYKDVTPEILRSHDIIEAEMNGTIRVHSGGATGVKKESLKKLTVIVSNEQELEDLREQVKSAKGIPD